MKCEICGKEILRDSQCINYKYYHNDCIENLQTEKEQLNSLVNSCQEEIRKLKKQLEDANEKIILLQASEPMLEWKKELEENQQKEFIEYLENEKDRLARECSQIYEDSLGKTRLVNEDIFNEVDTILSKYKSIIGDINDKK